MTVVGAGATDPHPHRTSTHQRLASGAEEEPRAAPTATAALGNGPAELWPVSAELTF